MIWLAQALKDVMQESVFAYVLPSKDMVNVLCLFYLTST